MVFEQIRKEGFISDKKFDQIFTQAVRSSAADHFTPVNVARAAAKYLVADGPTNVLDIGAGAGKFCMIGALSTSGNFTGIEQHPDLCDAGNALIQKHQINSVQLIAANITSIDFKAYEAFYFYNAFHELISEMNTTAEDRLHYKLNSAYVSAQLQEMPVGTRLATYYSLLKEVPASYALQSTKFSNNLKLWKKID